MNHPTTHLDGPDRDPVEAVLRAELAAAGLPQPVALRYAVALELLDEEGTATTSVVHARYGRCHQASAELLELVASWLTSGTEGGDRR